MAETVNTLPQSSEQRVIHKGRPLLEVKNLSVAFPSAAGELRAVRNISYTIHEGEFLGIVGESGSGKSVSSLAVMGLLPDTAKITGEILFDGVSLLADTW